MVEMPVNDFLCGKCCFDLDCDLKDRINMFNRMWNGERVCSRCGYTIELNENDSLVFQFKSY
jgi:hypothetical protein